MMSSRIAATVLLCAASTLPLTSSTIRAQRAAGELGYVDAAGLHVIWGPDFEKVQSQAAGAAERRQRDYERCRNPQSFDTSRVLGNALEILSGRRPRIGAFLQPRPQPTPRQDCGSPPSSAQVSATVQIVDADARANGRSAPLASFTFRNPTDNYVPGSQNLGPRCLALADSSGHLIPVRAPNDPDPYGFSNPFLPDPIAKAEAHVTQLRDQIERRESNVNGARAQLSTLAAYDRRSGSCVTPSRAALPPRPPSLSDAEVEDQAVGSCVDLMMRRQDPTKVIAAIKSVRQDGMIASAQRYRAKPAQCASSALYSQNEDFALRMICATSDIACYGQMQNVIQQCAIAVRASCGGPLEAWRNRVDAINRAPGEAKAQCDATLAVASGRDLDELRGELRMAEAELSAAKANRVSRQLPLSQARCGG